MTLTDKLLAYIDACFEEGMNEVHVSEHNDEVFDRLMDEGYEIREFDGFWIVGKG